jgi:hypothetical protein
MNYAANGLETTEPVAGYNLRRFRLRPLGNGTSLLLVDNGSGAFVPITGDVDVVGVTSTNGTLLSPQQRLTIYQSLQSADGVGMQHGETLSWLTGGEAQVKLLLDHVGDNAERLLVFDPAGGARTATIDAVHTTFTAADNSLNGVWFVGAYKTPQVSAFRNIVVVVGKLSELVGPWVGPTSWYLTGQGLSSGPPPNGNNNGQLGNCTWQFATGVDASTLRPDGNGGLQQYVPGKGWIPYQLPPQCGGGAGSGPSGGSAGGPSSLRAGSGAATGSIEAVLTSERRGAGVIAVEPQSALEAPVRAGTRALSIIPLGLVDPGALPARTAWFAAGDRIVIDPGGADQEMATITRLSPLELAGPLRHDHRIGEMVSVLTSPRSSAGSTRAESAPGAAGSGPGAGLIVPVVVLVLAALAGGGWVLTRRRSTQPVDRT